MALSSLTQNAVKAAGDVVGIVATYYVAKAIIASLTTIAVCALGIRAATHYKNDPSRYEGSFAEKFKTLVGDFQEDANKVRRIAHAISVIYVPVIFGSKKMGE